MAVRKGNPYLVWPSLFLAVLSLIFIILYELALIPRFVEETIAYFISVVVLLVLLIFLILLPSDHGKPGKARADADAVEVEPIFDGEEIVFKKPEGGRPGTGPDRVEYVYPPRSDEGIYSETEISIDERSSLTLLSDLA